MRQVDKRGNWKDDTQFRGLTTTLYIYVNVNQ